MFFEQITPQQSFLVIIHTATFGNWKKRLNKYDLFRNVGKRKSLLSTKNITASEQITRFLELLYGF